MYLYCSIEETIPYLCSLNFLTVLNTDINGFKEYWVRLFQILTIEKDFIILYMAIIVPVLPNPPLNKLFKSILRN